MTTVSFVTTLIVFVKDQSNHQVSSNESCNYILPSVYNYYARISGAKYCDQQVCLFALSIKMNNDSNTLAASGGCRPIPHIAFIERSKSEAGKKKFGISGRLEFDLMHFCQG